MRSATDGLGARSQRRRRWLRVILLVLLVPAAAAGWLVFRGIQTASALTDAGRVVSLMRSDMATANSDALVARLPLLRDDAAKAREATSDPLWRAAAHLPRIGPNFAAIAAVSAALDEVSRDALPAVEQAAKLTDLAALRGADGRIDLAPIAAAAPPLERAAASAAAASASVAGIDTGVLFTQLAGPVVQVQDGLADISDVFTGAARVTALAPPMLGADEPRTYLLLSLNSAELRSAGGIVGAIAELRADGGKVELIGQRTTADFPGLDEPVLPLTDEELQVHTDKLGRWVQNSVLTPDFPRTAALVSQFWRNAGGGEVDGVIATDPVAVSYLLRAISTVTEPGGRELSQKNVIAELLHDSYLRLPDPLKADRFYTGVAATIFGAVASGQGNATKLLRELGTAGSERRIRVWSAHPDEQAELATTSTGGAFLSGGADGAAGIFFNDGTGGKVDYFLKTAVSVESMTCTATTTTAIVRVALTYSPPADITSYPVYVTGSNGGSVPIGWVATNLTVYAPVGGTIGPITVPAGATGGLLAAESGRQVQVLTSRLQPGEELTYLVELRTPGPVQSLPVWVTPTLSGPGALTGSCVP